MIKVHTTTKDNVIKSTVALGGTDYNYALSRLFGLINRFEHQRKIQSRKFYERLRKDIISGCVMPPITLAFVNPDISTGVDAQIVEDFVNDNINDGYILDGLQRLTTLKEASIEESFSYKCPLYMNIIITEKYYFLLYRMITLNNGQKPMTARHQVEMLAGPLLSKFKVSNLSINILSEKETEGTRVLGSFRKSDIVEAYMAFLSDNVNNQNSKIIEERLDEIIVNRVMEADISAVDHTFEDILNQINRLCEKSYVKDWFRVSNHLIGFTVGARSTFKEIEKISPDEFADFVKKFDDAFAVINKSKVNVGKYKRELSRDFVASIRDLLNLNTDELRNFIFERTSNE